MEVYTEIRASVGYDSGEKMSDWDPPSSFYCREKGTKRES